MGRGLPHGRPQCYAAAASGMPVAGRKPARSAARPSTRAASRSSDFVCEAITDSRSRAQPSATSGGSTAPM